MTVLKNTDYNLEIRKGNVAGHSIVAFIGLNPEVDSSTAPEDIWDLGGEYTGFNATVAQTLDVVSDSANDTSAGTGARTLTIYGLDGSLLEVSEQVTLNGLTPVTTTQTFLRVNQVIVNTKGTGYSNEGTITIDQTTSGIVMAGVNPLTGSSHQACGTVPSNKDYYALQITASMDDTLGDNKCEFDIEFRLNVADSAWVSVYPFGVTTQGSVTVIDTIGRMKFPAGTDFKIRCMSAQNNNGIPQGSISFIVVEQ